MGRVISESAERAAAAVDSAAIAADLGALVRVASLTGQERPAVELLAELSERRGLTAQVHEHDLAALRSAKGYPGEEAPRDELVGATVTLAGQSDDAPRLCLNGHVDVVDPGTAPWQFGPWAGDEVGGFIRGRGAADMKGGVIAALHAMAAVRAALGDAPGEVVLYGVGSEEDGGLGTFAALERDHRFDACLIPEPTAFDIVCAQAGALTFEGVVPGVSAHAALRLEGESAIDRYMPVHAALHDHERHVNANVDHPLMSELELPYPLLVGRVEAGTWSSQVPDRLRFEGRLGVRVDQTPTEARAGFEAVVQSVCPDAELTWTGGQFAPAETPQDHPFPRLVASAIEQQTERRPRFIGSSYGSDMRLFCERGIPCVMAGTSGIELAHAVDERVALGEVVALARSIARVIVRFGELASPA
ncbi:MAG: M20 family metallopeptidase [Thermoleophilaceae bacterium]